MSTEINQFTNVELFLRSTMSRIRTDTILFNPEYGLLNRSYDNFNTKSESYGKTVTINVPYRGVLQTSLVPVNTAIVQKTLALSVDNLASTKVGWGDIRYLFNLAKEKDVPTITQQAVADADIIKDALEVQGFRYLANNATIQNSDEANNGTRVSLEDQGFYRVYANGWNIFSGNQYAPYTDSSSLASIANYYENFSYAPNDKKLILPKDAQASIVKGDLLNFVMDRNEDMSRGYRFGSFQNNYDCFASDHVQTFTAGLIGNAANVGLRLVSFSKTDDQINQATFILVDNTDTPLVSGGTPDLDPFLNAPGCAVQGDCLHFSSSLITTDVATKLQRGVFLLRKYNSPDLSTSFVQVKVLQDATVTLNGSGQGEITLLFSPRLDARSESPEQNILQDPQLGMLADITPSGRRSAIYSGNPFYFASPPLPDLDPYDYAHRDEDGFSIRFGYYRSDPTANPNPNTQKSQQLDCTYGYAVYPHAGMILMTPSQPFGTSENGFQA